MPCPASSVEVVMLQVSLARNLRQACDLFHTCTHLASLDAEQPEDGTGGVGIVPLLMLGQGTPP